MRSGGILSGSPDDDPRKRPTWASVPAERGLVVEHIGSGERGEIVEFGKGLAKLRRASGSLVSVGVADGAFRIDGRIVNLVAPTAVAARSGPVMTASGSVAAPKAPARVARASRIWVEGIHDAELLEKVWGDDLRIEGIVVEQLEGMDDLVAHLKAFAPQPGRRVGVLLDHLVPGSKEQRVADQIDHPQVLVTGHPYVDVWAAIRPGTLGIDAWPEVPRGQPWKEGVIAALGVTEEPGRFWRRVLGAVTTYADLEPALVNAVERMIDFTAATED